MKQHWHVKPLPPPEDSSDRPDGFVGLALLALIFISPMIYFGHQLGALEAWLLQAYGSIENWISPIRDWLLG
ncbi:MAG: hypothetical protein EKK31_01350 [Hyphomicrobiales bacterium]|nr:MAG: hypothetical protein EKK31_01350 [Hyphomicrobiales bacterium]